MAARLMRSCRMMLAAFVALSVVASLPLSAMARDTIDVTGTVDSKNEDKETIVFFTDDLGVKNQPITIDMSDISSAFRSIKDGQSATIEVLRRESNTWKAYSIRSEGSYVHRADYGAAPNFETKDDSIKAHVGNVPEDDESLSQQHRENNLRRDEDDDHDNCCAPD
jgi:hypothetical protein